MAEGVVTVRQLKSILTCPICNKELNDARVLKCGHVFCFMCIKRDYEQHRLNKGNCPVCNEVYFLKERDTQYLPKASIVNDILDQLKTAVYQCAFCRRADGSMICLKCKLDLCRRCSKSTISFCRHRTVTMDYLNRNRFLREIVQRSMSNQACPSHSDEDECQFCQHCEVVTCAMCCNEEHRDHDVMELNVLASRIKDENVPQKLEKKEQDLEKFLKQFEQPTTLSTLMFGVPATDEEIRECHSHRKECSDLHKQMWDLFEYGSDKAILELFYKHKTKIDLLLSYDPRNRRQLRKFD